MNHIIKISASLALTAGMMFTTNTFPYNPANKVLLDIDGKQMTYVTQQDTVGEFLQERGVTLKAEDRISVPVSSKIEKNEQVEIELAVPVSITADGQVLKVNTLAKDVHSLLTSLGITVDPSDRMNAALTDHVTPDMAITIQRVVTKEETKSVPVAFTTVRENSASLLKGKEKTETKGSDGERQITTQSLFVDGVLESSKVVSDIVAKAPVNEVILVGTKAPVVKKAVPKAVTVKASETTAAKSTTTSSSTSSVSSSTSQNWKSFTLTFYTNLPSENGGYTITATGKSLSYGMVASNYYSLGKKIYLNGYGTMTVEDRGGSNFNSSSRLDVFIPRKSGESNTAYLSRVNSMGIQTVKGYVK